MLADPAPRHWRRRLCALGLSLAASLLLAELFVRVAVGAPLCERLPILMIRANSHRGWEMVPGQLHYTYQYPVHVNSLGLRGKELGEKRPSEVRVLALGDSLVYGQGVADEETLPAQLERVLGEREPGERTWTVVNAGHRAFDTRQELALLQELGQQIQPDVVVLFWYWNDFAERDIRTTYENLKASGEVAFDTGTRVEGWERVRWQAKQLVRRSALVMLAYDLLRRSREGPINPTYVERGFARLGRHLERFRSLGDELGFDGVLAVIPDPSTLRGGSDIRSIAERAAALTREHGLPVVELLPALEPLQGRAGRLPVIPFDGHYLPEAYRAMAELLAERLVALGLPGKHE